MAEDSHLFFCPNCQDTVLLDEAHDYRQATCRTCGEQTELAGRLCPNCYRYHPENEPACELCGTPLTRICNQCRTTNWTGALTCFRCGSSLDLLQYVKPHGSQATAQRLKSQMSQARSLKELEDGASEKRMASLMAIEAERLEKLNRRLARQQYQERRILLVTLTSLAIFILILALVYLLR